VIASKLDIVLFICNINDLKISILWYDEYLETIEDDINLEAVEQPQLLILYCIVPSDYYLLQLLVGQERETQQIPGWDYWIEKVRVREEEWESPWMVIHRLPGCSQTVFCLTQSIYGLTIKMVSQNCNYSWRRYRNIGGFSFCGMW